YPQAEFPYARLVEENRRRGRDQPEYELADTGVFEGDRYFDVRVEYAKGAPDDLLIRLTIANRAPVGARLHLLPTVWFRNTWDWGRHGEGQGRRGRIAQVGPCSMRIEHPTLGEFRLVADRAPAGRVCEQLFTENATNFERLYGSPNPSPWVKDAFHEYVVHGRHAAVNPDQEGTKAAIHYVLEVPAHGEVAIRLRLFDEEAAPEEPLGPGFEAILDRRRAEADAFWNLRIPAELDDDARNVSRQAYAGLLWTKQFYHYAVGEWL